MASSFPTTAARIFRSLPEIRSEGYKTLQENQRVSFEVGTGPKGPSAKNIKVSA